MNARARTHLAAHLAILRGIEIATAGHMTPGETATAVHRALQAEGITFARRRANRYTGDVAENAGFTPDQT